MSLQIWLPLNGSVKNQGLLDGELIQSGTPTYVDGKMGKSLAEGISLQMSATQTAKVLNNREFSICFWVYINADTGTSESLQFFGNADMSTSNNRKYYLTTYPTVNDLHWSWMNDEPNKTIASCVASAVLPSYKWTHVALTYGNNSTGKIYINGKLNTTFYCVSNSSSFAYSTYLMRSTDKRYLNDYRIYDNCLSSKEVKEISKGLVCHFPMNHNNLGNPNIAINTNDNSKWHWSMETGDYTETYEECDDGSTWCVFTRGSAATGSWSYISYPDINSASGYKVSTNYTISFDVYLTTGATFTCSLRQVNFSNPLTVSNVKTQYIQPNTPTRVSITVTTVDTLPTTLGSQCLYMAGFTQPSGCIIKLKNLKIEEGSVATPWCPNVNDALYSTLGLNDTTESDCSGYNNNGEKVGSITWSGDSPRYNGSYHFTTNGAINKIPNPLNSTSTDFTISFWCKIENLSATHTFYTARTAYNTGQGIAVFYTSNSGFRLDDGSLGQFSIKPLVNTWTHVCMVRSASSKKLYINGSLVETLTTVGSLTDIGNYGTIGGSCMTTEGIANANFTKGNISDFRIYTTALSEDDILTLYNSPISIDKNSNLYAYGFIESNVIENKFNKSGIIDTNNLYESDAMNFLSETDHISYTPSTSSNSCLSLNILQNESMSLVEGEDYYMEFDIVWSGFDESNTNGSFSMTFNGQYVNSSGTTVWPGSSGSFY